MKRHFWVLVHRYAGLYMAFFLLVAGLTGSILAFSPEINNLLNPPEKVEPFATHRLDEFALKERAESLQPQGQILMMSFNRKVDEAYTALFTPRIDLVTQQPFELTFDRISLNPYTGIEISKDKLGDDLWPITRKNFISLIISLHYKLALPDSIGVWLFGIAALIWTIDCFVSAYLTFPISVYRYQTVTEFKQRSWLSRWKSSWLVKWRGSALRINFDLHRAGGLWVWLMLLILAWSSVGFNLNEQVYIPVMKTVFNMPDPMALAPKLDKPIPYPALSWQEAQRIGRENMASQATLKGFNVVREDMLQYTPDYGVFFYIVHTNRDLIEEVGSTWLVLDGATGQYLGLNLPTGQNAGSTLNSWIFALHTAMIWGLPYKIFLSGVGLVIAMLSITGVYIWFKKLRAKRLSKERKGR